MMGAPVRGAARIRVGELGTKPNTKREESALRARKNDNAHCEQKNWTHVRQLMGYDRFGHSELVPMLNELYGREWSQYQNHFRSTFKLEKREKKGSKTVKSYEKKPQTPYQRLLASEAIPEANKARLREEHETFHPLSDSWVSRVSSHALTSSDI